MSALLDDDRVRLHKLRNVLHSLLLVAGVALLMSFCAYLLWGAPASLGPWRAPSRYFC